MTTPLNDETVVALYNDGDSYDLRRSGVPRSLRLQRFRGKWFASWSNGPFDSSTVEAVSESVTAAIRLLATRLEQINLSDEDEQAAE